MSVSVIAIDIEGRGRSAIRNGIVSIGMYAALSDGTFVKTRINVAPYPDQVMEPRCQEEFWDKNPGLLAELSKNQRSASDAMRHFRNLLDIYDELSTTAALYIVCDTPAYDFHFINYYLDREGLPLLQFDVKGEFRATHDADSYARGVMRMPFKDQWVYNDALARALKLPELTADLVAHAPEDDAHKILHAHVALVERG
jgi:hypothetical protein